MPLADLFRPNKKTIKNPLDDKDATGGSADRDSRRRPQGGKHTQRGKRKKKEAEQGDIWMATAVDDLPDEILAHCFAFLVCIDRRTRASVVCRRWRSVALDDASIGRVDCVMRAVVPARRDATRCLVAAAEAAVAAGHRDCTRHLLDGRPRLYDPSDRIAVAAARAGDVSNFDYLRTLGYELGYGGAIINAARCGQTTIVAHILDGRAGALPHPKAVERALQEAVYGDHLDCATYLSSRCPSDSYGACIRAAERGRIDMLCMLVADGHTLCARTCAQAAAGGHLEMLAHLHESGCPWDVHTCANAARIGRIDILGYARARGCPWSASTCSYAASAGHLDVLIYVRDRGCPWDGETLVSAATIGRMDILAYACDNACPQTAYATAAAACERHMDALVYLYERGCPWTSRVCAHAAANGDLAMLTFAREHGCPWDKATCAAAVGALCRAPSTHGRVASMADATKDEGRLACLSYARAHGCPIDDAPCYYAVVAGNMELLRRVRAIGSPWHADTTRLAAAAGRNAIVIYAHEDGCVWHWSTVTAAAARGAYNILRYALAHGCPYDADAAIEAARRGFPYDADAAIEAARLGGHWRCVDLLTWAGMPGDDVFD